MNKILTFIDFWKSFGWAAYDENSVPEDAPDHYIIYEVISDSIGNANLVTVSLLDYSNSWERVQKKADEIEQAITTMYPPTLRCDTGRVYITCGSPFSQRVNIEEPPWKRMRLNIEVEYLTNY